MAPSTSSASQGNATKRNLSPSNPRRDIIVEGTGYSPLVFESMDVLANNGVLVMVGVTEGDRKLEIPADKINLGFVLGNKAAIGSVNANREYFEMGGRRTVLSGMARSTADPSRPRTGTTGRF